MRSMRTKEPNAKLIRTLHTIRVVQMSSEGIEEIPVQDALPMCEMQGYQIVGVSVVVEPHQSTCLIRQVSQAICGRPVETRLDTRFKSIANILQYLALIIVRPWQ